MRPYSVRDTGTRRLHQTVDFLIGKASHFTGFAGNADRHLIGCPVLTGATEVEQLISILRQQALNASRQEPISCAIKSYKPLHTHKVQCVR